MRCSRAVLGFLLAGSIGDAQRARSVLEEEALRDCENSVRGLGQFLPLVEESSWPLLPRDSEALGPISACQLFASGTPQQ